MIASPNALTAQFLPAPSWLALFRPSRCAWAFVLWLVCAAGLSAFELQASELPAPPNIPAASYVLIDHVTGIVLAESNADEVRAPASLTKLMTAYVAFEAVDEGLIALDELVPVSEKAWRMRGSRMFIEVGTEVAVDDLLRGLLVQSGNDAAVALGERIAGSVEAFVALMNARADELGMASTEFKNPTGLPAVGHVSTARDLALLAQLILNRFPHHVHYFSEREFTFNAIRQYNRNRLLGRGLDIDGMKTGYTDSAGYCIVTTALRNGMRVIAVALGAETPAERLTAGERLIEYGFSTYETHSLFAAGEPLRDARVWKGEASSAPVGVVRDLQVTIPKGAYEALSAVVSFRTDLVAPIEAHTEIGRLNVSLGEVVLHDEPVVVLERVPLGGLWTQLKDSLALRLKRDE